MGQVIFAGDISGTQLYRTCLIFSSSPSPSLSFAPLLRTMATTQKDFGRLISVYGVSPRYLQRAVIVAVLSFLFFITMMFGFYLRQNVGYFLLATAFLIVYLVMMFSLLTQRRSMVRVFENGLEYRKNRLEWGEMESIDVSSEIVLIARDGRRISLPSSISETEALTRHITFKIAAAGAAS